MDVSEWLKADSVRHTDKHSLRVDRSLTPGDRERRIWACICGHRFGLLFDNAAKGAYRQHLKDSSSLPNTATALARVTGAVSVTVIRETRHLDGSLTVDSIEHSE